MTKPRDLATLGGGFTQAGTGAIQRTVENKLKDTVSVKDFGAVGNGTTDDTAAIQAAINYCLSQATPLVNGQSLIPVLKITGMCRITASLKIDRPEGQTGFFRIMGDGVVGGFLTTAPITIISTNYVGSNVATPANSVLSNQVSFENLTFASTDGTNQARAIDLTKFVRTQITGCFFSGIGLNPNPTNCYIQSCWIDNCFVRGVPTKWLDTVDAYDVRVTNSLFEVVSDTCIYISGKTYAGVFNNNLSQSCGNLFFNTSYTYSCEITGNYIEANVGRFVKVDNAYGLNVCSNFVQTRTLSPANSADTTFFEIYIGESYGSEIHANYFTARGVQVEGTSKITLVTESNYAATQLLKTGQTLTNGVKGNFSSGSFIPTSSVIPVNGFYLSASNTPAISANSIKAVEFTSDRQIRAFRSDGSRGLTIQGPAIFDPGNGIGLSSGGSRWVPADETGVAVDNTKAFGSASFRWSEIYAGSGTINTSDQRDKQDIAVLNAAESRVAFSLKSLIKKFRFKDAVQTKGNQARIHVGVIVQDVIAAFKAEGLDPMRYGIVCYDQWDAELDQDGNETRPAGDRYGIRYEELLAFIISAL